jgi:hypothetical protein
MMIEPRSMIDHRAEHAHVNASRHEGPLAKSLQLIQACALSLNDPIIDVGGASAALADALLRAGYRDITILDPSHAALDLLREQLGERAGEVVLINEDVTRFRPQRRYALWHDMGVFHRFTHAEERQEYVEVLQQALRPEGHVVIATCGPEGAERTRDVPVRRYSAQTLEPEFGSQFQLAEHAIVTHRAPLGDGEQFLHCRFRRNAPQWPH